MRVERELHTDLGTKVVLYIEHPMKSGLSDNEFSCKIGLEGEGIDISTVIFGIDPLQAMILSLRHLTGFVPRISRSLHPRYLIWEWGCEENDFGLL